jgi:hypothetical protein
MTGGGRGVALGPCHADSMHPDLGWLEAELAGPRPPKMVVIVNPCNPTGDPLHPPGVRAGNARVGQGAARHKQTALLRIAGRLRLVSCPHRLLSLTGRARGTLFVCLSNGGLLVGVCECH